MFGVFRLVDNHYYSIASKATLLEPKELNVPNAKFEKQFGLSWEAALKQGNVYNATGACEVLGVDASQLNELWAKCKKDKKMVKLGGGFYCGLIEVTGKPSIYAFNGFFMSMRGKFTAADASIHYLTVEWDSSKLSWEHFRATVQGATDPTTAEASSIRAMIYNQWQPLGLASEPNVGDNGLHASASPFEALAERMNWLGGKLESDAFGAQLLKAGIPAATVMAWSKDPQVAFEEEGKTGKFSLFDLLEDLDAADCVAKCVEIFKYGQAEEKETTVERTGYRCELL